MRKLATIRKVLAVTPIPDADAIECVQVDGWKVVVKKGEFKEGDLALYFEIDSWIPESVAPFLCKDKREFNGVSGARLRTVRLRKQISQGLLLPAPQGTIEGDDLTEAMSIQKYEASIPAQLAGTSRGNFPSFIPKTDQERIQNLRHELGEWVNAGALWEVTEKLDGSSMTAYIYQGEFGVCSRNLDLKESDNNAFWAAARKYNLEELLRATGRNLAIQGELIGPGIQGNKYGLVATKFCVFDVYDIDAGAYLPSEARTEVTMDLEHCPILRIEPLRDTQESILLQADGTSMVGVKPSREGLVYKCLSDPSLSFKAISNAFLMAEK